MAYYFSTSLFWTLTLIRMNDTGISIIWSLIYSEAIGTMDFDECRIFFYLNGEVFLKPPFYEPAARPDVRRQLEVLPGLLTQCRAPGMQNLLRSAELHEPLPGLTSDVRPGDRLVKWGLFQINQIPVKNNYCVGFITTVHVTNVVCQIAANDSLPCRDKILCPCEFLFRGNRAKGNSANSNLRCSSSSLFHCLATHIL